MLLAFYPGPTGICERLCKRSFEVNLVTKEFGY